MPYTPDQPIIVDATMPVDERKLEQYMNEIEGSKETREKIASLVHKIPGENLFRKGRVTVREMWEREEENIPGMSLAILLAESEGLSHASKDENLPEIPARLLTKLQELHPRLIMVAKLLVGDRVLPGNTADAQWSIHAGTDRDSANKLSHWTEGVPRTSDRKHAAEAFGRICRTVTHRAKDTVGWFETLKIDLLPPRLQPVAQLLKEYLELAASDDAQNWGMNGDIGRLVQRAPQDLASAIVKLETLE